MAAAKFDVPVEVAGPTGAVAATRYAGATASGAPASGSFLKGDFVVAQDGKVWVCTAAGTPGTWADVGSGSSGAPTDATYITQTTNGTLSAEQALASLSTGVVKVTTTTGVLSTAAEGTDYWKPGGTDVAVADGGTGASTAGGARTNLGLGGAAVLAVGTTTGTVAAGDDSRLSDTRTPTDNSVTSAKIVDGAIVDADVNASAAIAYSKLALANSLVAGDLTTGAVTSAKILDGTIVAADIAVAARPRDHRLLTFGPTAFAEAYPRWAVNNNGSLLTSARLSAVAIPVLSGDVITNVSFLSATTALSGPANVWFALCDSSFNVIRQSTDQVAGAAWASNSLLTLATDSVPVTAGARVASTTVTLTFPTLSQSLATIFTAGDSIVVANANVAAYNGTFTIVTVGASTITYVSGGSATDSLVAPFPTVKLAAGKRTYTVAADGYVYGVVMVKGTVPTLGCFNALSGATAITPLFVFSGDTGLTGTCPSPVAHATTSSIIPWTGVS